MFVFSDGLSSRRGSVHSDGEEGDGDERRRGLFLYSRDQ